MTYDKNIIEKKSNQVLEKLEIYSNFQIPTYFWLIFTNVNSARLNSKSLKLKICGQI